MSIARKMKTRPWTRRKAELDVLFEEAIVDAYGESDQLVGFYTMLEGHLGMPFNVEILGVTAVVEHIDMTDDGQIVAICRRDCARQLIPIRDLVPPMPPPAGAGWIGLDFPRFR